MLSVGIVSFGYRNKRDCKKLTQRINTVTRRLQSYTHPVTFKIIEAANYDLINAEEKDDWTQLITDQDGFLFLVPRNTEDINDSLTQSLQICSSGLTNKPLLIFYYGEDDTKGSDLDVAELARSFEMPVLYKSIDLPFLDETKVSSLALFQQVESDMLIEIEKLLYWTMGMKHTRDLMNQQDQGASSSS